VSEAWQRAEKTSTDVDAPTSRQVHWPEIGFVDTPIYRSEHLADEEIHGPAVIESTYSTMLVERGQTARGDLSGNVILTFDGVSTGPVMSGAATGAEA
jgi:N-methylhydantoinase A/oxoprolinase/acetone carboxylase beta subunit